MKRCRYPVAAILLLVAFLVSTPTIGRAQRRVLLKLEPGMPPGVQWLPDIAYRTVAEGPIALDIYRPKTAKTPRPVVVMIHRGGWRGGDKAAFLREAPELALLGYAAVSIDYRQPAKARGMEMLDDVQCAIRWVRKNAKTYRFDPDRIGLVGGSNGAHLAALAATWPDRPCPEPALADYPATVTCVVDFFGPTDLRVKEVQSLFLPRFSKALKKDPDFFTKFSPIVHVSPKAPPFLILHGEADKVIPIRQSEAFQAALKKAGVPVEMIRYPKAPHAFIVFLGPKSRPSSKSWPYREAWDATQRFLAKHLEPKK